MPSRVDGAPPGGAKGSKGCTVPWLAVGVLAALFAVVAASSCVIPPPEQRLQTIGKATVTELDPAGIRVLVWNIHKSGDEGWWTDFRRLTAGHDLLLLQEGAWDDPLRAQFGQLAREQTVQWWLGVTFVLGDTASGTLLGSRARPTRLAVRHSAYAEPVVGTPKSHQSALFEVAGLSERLLVINVHAINFRLGSAPFAHQLHAVLEDARAYPGPAVLAGDFNTWTDWREQRLHDAASSAGFASVFPRAPADDGEDGRPTALGHYLDHAFVRGLAVEPGSVRVLADVASSDHAPLSFVVTVPSSP